MRRAFTLVEMLVAVVLLIAIIVATGKIFATARQVASVGEASADVLQQASLLREQLQRDLDRISRDGYVAIQCVVVRNDAAAGSSRERRASTTATGSRCPGFSMTRWRRPRSTPTKTASGRSSPEWCPPPRSPTAGE